MKIQILTRLYYTKAMSSSTGTPARKRRSTDILTEYDNRRIKIDYQPPRLANPKNKLDNVGENKDKADLVRLVIESKLDRSKKENTVKRGDWREEVQAVCCSCTVCVRDETLCCRRCGHERCAECLLLSGVRERNSEEIGHRTKA